MPGRVVYVNAPARLHFGLLSFGGSGEREFGGVGAMVSPPLLRLRISSCERLEVDGPLGERVLNLARRWFEADAACASACRIEVQSAPRQHAGLGAGTQLALAVAAGLEALFSRPRRQAEALALLMGRGGRSAIGTYGFDRGGLLVEAGKLPGEPLSPLIARVELPSEWRFVLLIPPGQEGLSGDRERQAFASLPPVPREITAELCRETMLHLLPAAQEGRFDDFSRSLYRFGHRAGMCFAALQGGPFASPWPERLVTVLRSLGIEGAGQTSWGPTVFGLVPSQAAAEDLVRLIQARNDLTDIECLIAAPDNVGGQVQVRDD